MGKVKMLPLLLAAALGITACGPNAPEGAASPAVQTDPSQAGEYAQSAQSNEERISTVGFFFDTVVTITLYGAEESTLDEILEQCAAYEALLSKTVEGSDVWKINHAQGQPVELSDATREVLETGLLMGETTDGRFDITVAPAVSLWDFTGDSARLPSQADLNAALKKVDYTQIELDGNTVTLPSGWSIDLGGVAKGYIADQITLFCTDRGVAAGTVNLGGNVVAFGSKPGGEAWVVGIQDPQSATGDYNLAVSIPEGSVVTSGIYERGFELDGLRYHHILDPATGYPVQNELASVTVLSESSMWGDALSTACLLLGYEGALKLLSDFPNAEAIFITRDGNTLSTPGAEDAIIQ